MRTVDVTRANVVPTKTDSAEGVRELLASDGAAIVSGLLTEADAAAFATELLGDRLLRINRQFEASKRHYEEETPRINYLPTDARGRKKSYTAPSERMIPHNDGFSFGDFAPDYLFLWCERPAMPAGGDSYLINAHKLVQLLEADPATAGLAAFCWQEDIDQSEPAAPQPYEAPIARHVASGRVQVRNNPYFMAKEGPQETEHAPLVEQWQDMLIEARDNGPTFRVEAGDLICADNYRLLHGRYAYEDPARTLYSIWGWTTDGVAVPKESLDISAPVVPTAY